MTRTSRSPSLAAGANIGVPNEGYVPDLLDGHNAYQRPGLLVAPEPNTPHRFHPAISPWSCTWTSVESPAVIQPEREAFERVRFWSFLTA
jgi:hypothetical protein